MCHNEGMTTSNPPYRTAPLPTHAELRCPRCDHTATVPYGSACPPAHHAHQPTVDEGAVWLHVGDTTLQESDEEILRCDNCHQTFPSEPGWSVPGDLCPSPHTVDPAPLCPGALRVYRP